MPIIETIEVKENLAAEDNFVHKSAFTICFAMVQIVNFLHAVWTGGRSCVLYASKCLALMENMVKVAIEISCFFAG